MASRPTGDLRELKEGVGKATGPGLREAVEALCDYVNRKCCDEIARTGCGYQSQHLSSLVNAAMRALKTTDRKGG